MNHFSFLQKEEHITPPFLFSHEKQKRIYEEWGIGSYEEGSLRPITNYREEEIMNNAQEGWMDERGMLACDTDTFTLTYYDIPLLEKRLHQEGFLNLHHTYETLKQQTKEEMPFELASHEIFAEESDYDFLYYVHTLVHYMKDQHAQFGQTSFVL